MTVATADPIDTTVSNNAAVNGLEEAYERLPIEHLIESPFNPRKTFNPVKLSELADSIRQKDVVEPLVVRPWSKGASDRFEIICGARRYRAAKIAGRTHLPTVIRQYTDAQAIEIMAIENGQRDDVPPLEEAAGYKQLLLVAKTYTAKMIAEKIGRTEKFVWDRLRLLELIPEIKALLTDEEIGVEHAEVLAKLKASEQRSLVKGPSDFMNRSRGLWAFDGALDFEDDPTRTKKRKPVSVRELKQYIAEHVRLDVKHAAAAAPLEFGETARRVEAAEAEPGRGKKVVPITFSHMCPDGAKDPAERTYGASAWKKAENKAGEATCDYAVLGVVVAGEHYGESFKVCINRDRCVTHWKDSVKAKEKANALRAKGKTKQAVKVEKKQQAKTESTWDRQNRERNARAAVWKKLWPDLEQEVISQVKAVRELTPQQGEYFLEQYDIAFDKNAVVKHLGKHWVKHLAAALLVSEVVYRGGNEDAFDAYVKSCAKPLGLDIKRLEAIRDKHQPPAAAPSKGKKGGKK